jgi:hypothetical protein
MVNWMGIQGLSVKRQSSRLTYSFSDKETEAKARRTSQVLRSWPQEKFQAYLKSLNKAEQKRLLGVLAAVQNLECSESLETFARYVLTKDEHGKDEGSVRPFPTRVEKPYVWEVLDTIQREQIIAVEKSRQLMVTWLVCLYILWECKFRQNRLWFVQSKKENDAANLVFNSDWNTARISFMECHLPEVLRSDCTTSYSSLQFRDTGSRAWGIPEGADQIRSYTASGIFSDEAAFQPEFENAFKASNASIKGGGKLIVVSSARSGAFMKKLLRRA